MEDWGGCGICTQHTCFIFISLSIYIQYNECIRVWVDELSASRTRVDPFNIHAQRTSYRILTVLYISS